jgi:hypothetical protein
MEVIMEAALITLFINVFNFLKINTKESRNWINEIKQDKDFFGKAVNSYCDNLRKRCETLKILNMEKPIKLGQIYASVNILQKITHRIISPICLLEEQLKAEGHFGLVKGTTSVLELINKQTSEKQMYNNIVILGKPGAGKTTFLRYTALEALKGQDGKLNRIVLPILIELRDLSYSSMSLMECLEKQFDICGISHKPFIERVLSEGKCLVLLDGLDEVKKSKTEELIRQVKDLVDKYNKNQFVLTCRIAAYNYVFEHFIDTEIADFNHEQIKNFVNQWFWPDQTEKAVTFLEGLEADKSIRELATTPLLLALMCMDYGERGVFPNNRATLYRKCVETLLEKWDGTRNIHRDAIYKNLDSITKELMFARIAATMFEQEKIFLPEELLSNLVGEFIKHLPNTKIEDLDVNSKQVIKAIEAQHGIFIERAESIYSFSHLTFQEYFTAKYIIINKRSLQNLIDDHLLKVRWKEVILLITGLVGEADDFLLSIKRKIDSLIDNELGYLFKKVFEWDNLSDIFQELRIENINVKKVLTWVSKHEAMIIRLYMFCLLVTDMVASIAMSRQDCFQQFYSCVEVFDSISTDIFYISRHYLSYDICRIFDPSTFVTARRNTSKVINQFFVSDFDSKGFDVSWFLSIIRFHMSENTPDEFDKVTNVVMLQGKKIKDYVYGANLLLECLNSDCYVTKETRKIIVSGLLIVPEDV